MPKKPEPLKVFYVTGNTSLTYKFRGHDAAFLPAPTPDEYYWCVRDPKGNWMSVGAAWDEITSFEYTGEVVCGRQ